MGERTDPKVKNDYAFLQEIKKPNHTPTFRGLDRRTSVKRKLIQRRLNTKNVMIHMPATVFLKLVVKQTLWKSQIPSASIQSYQC